MLYISVASTCNECNETSLESATLLRGTLDGKSRSIFASGLRDVVGWGWHPETGELRAMDHGMDWLGDNKQVEELITSRSSRSTPSSRCRAARTATRC